MTEYSPQIELLLIQSLLFPLLYAETHYKFRYFFSYLKKKEPEIIADIPLRVITGSSIPVLVVIKDADKYPVCIDKISVLEHDQIIFSQTINEQVSETYYDILCFVTTSDLSCGEHLFDVKINYQINGQHKICYSDNHRGTNHKPLSTNILEKPLPRFDNCILGETHSHTNYTSDQVEFGASLKATKVMAKALDLNFFCATDHSYDLDDYRDDYLQNDPQLGKWIDFQHEVEQLNKGDNDVLIIPGEEVTVRNNNDKNVHLLLYNSKKFFPGSGDSGEKWLQKSSEYSIAEVVSEITDSVLAVSAHPAETPPFLQRLFINRGSWQPTDCAQSRLEGLQFINGGENVNINNGKKLWVEQLLSNNRLTGIAGNDAHGNFARFRQIGFPFFTMRENSNHLFGKWITGCYVPDDKPGIPSIISALKTGNCYMTNGPALQMHLQNSANHYMMGEECPSPEKLRISARSTEDFGSMFSLNIILGDLTTKTESVFFEQPPELLQNEYKREISLDKLPKRGYLRAELKTQKNFQALSNPIWFSHNPIRSN